MVDAEEFAVVGGNTPIDSKTFAVKMAQAKVFDWLMCSGPRVNRRRANMTPLRQSRLYDGVSFNVKVLETW